MTAKRSYGAEPPVRKTEPDGATEKEIQSTGSQYREYPPILTGRTKKFIPPREDQDSELVKLFEREAAYAEDVLKALPPHAFERWEFEEIVQQSPEIAPSVLYARIEELVSQEPTVSERDLLTAIARDLGRSPDDFAAGFDQWKKVAPKARVYVDLLRRVQDRMKEQREAE